MDLQQFTESFITAFGSNVQLPIAFYYDDLPATQPEKVAGCFFKAFPRVREEGKLTLDSTCITCPGGKFYTGFGKMNERIFDFVSLSEKYKESPDLVKSYVEDLALSQREEKYLNFVRIDQLESADKIEGFIFIATPDTLSGLFTWAVFDNNSTDAVSSLFASGCCAAITYAMQENARGGRRTFLGGFDPSVRPFFADNELTFSVPMSRMKEMALTFTKSCLFGTHAWEKVKARINGVSV